MTAVFENKTSKAGKSYDSWEVSLEETKTYLFLSLLAI